MKKIFAVLIAMLAVFCVLTACSNNESVIENDEPLFENEENPGESCTLPEDAMSTKEPEANPSAPEPEDFDSIFLFDEDSSPIIALTEEERAEFLEIIGSYEFSETEEIDPAIGTIDRSIILTGRENSAALYSKELSGEGLLTVKWNKEKDMIAYDVSGDLYYDLADFRNLVQKNARDDGRWPFLFPDEDSFSYSDNPPEFDEEHFLKELDTFIFCIAGEYSFESDRLGPERAGLYCVTKVYKDSVANGENLPYDSDGRVLVPKEDVDRAAKYVFGIAEYSHYKPAENGCYTVPFDWRILNYKVGDIETDGAYITCSVIFTDPGDVDFEWEPLAKKVYRFTRFETDDEIWYRPVAAWYEFGGEYGF